jgi:hypothetical protein
MYFTLLLLCFIVLGVLGKVTEGARCGNVLFVLLSLNVYKVVILLLRASKPALV